MRTSKGSSERGLDWRATGLIAGLIAITVGQVGAARANSSEGVPGYLGSAACASCHPAEHALWRGSHHDLAMQPATEETVLGRFDGATFDHLGTESRFFRRDGTFIARTDGPDGALHDYEIAYTFGVDPLQQYLVAFPGGRYQVLDIAWDTRLAAEGGQRWMHLHPDDPVRAGDVLHWTGPNLNWNFMCAGCHSTNLRKGYDIEKNAYDTTWSEIDVACEACHGAGERHVERVRKLASSGSSEPLRPHGLLIDFDERRGVKWSIDPKTGKPRRSKARTSRVEIDACARCHSRRSQLTETDRAGSPLLDHYLPTLLADGLYHADGQVADEVYVYGSFLQSRMAQAGVTCSDCHEPHSGELRAPGDQVCGQCHALERYAAKVHHHHAPGSGAAACTSCHMPATTFMEVDVRRDHGFRIPSAALSSAVGSPDVCTDCHLGRTQSWAATTLQQWAGSDSAGYQRFGPALFAAREGSAHARPLLAELLRDEQQPSIARATALQLLAGHLDEAGLALVERALGHADPMLRFGALEALRTVPLSVAWPLASPLLADPILAVRIQAARQLAPALAGELPPEQATALRAVIDEYVSVQRVNGERPESHVNLATLYTELGEPVDAEAEYRRALVLQDQFVPAYVNLADLLSRRGQEDDADALLRTGMQRVPDSADLNHALGLSLVRQKRLEEALTALQRASALAPENSRYAYVQAVALDSSGDTRQAIAVLEAVHARASGDVAVLQALVSYQRKVGNIQAAQVYEQRLARLTRASGGTGRAGR